MNRACGAALVLLFACGDSGDPGAGGSGGAGGNTGAGNQGAGQPGGASEGGAGAGSSGGNGTGGEAPVVPACVLGCDAAADCATASPVTDADNWSCDDGRCRYLGCQSTTECQQGFASPNYVCETPVGAPLPTCVHTCTAAIDCATTSPLTDADNWSCADSRCVYEGCQSTTECQQAYASPSYVCEALEGLSFPICAQTCDTTTDCATASALTDADNWSCDEMRCLYLGCKSTAECQETLLDASYTCE